MPMQPRRHDDGPLPSDIQELQRLAPGCVIEVRGSWLRPPVDNFMHRLRVESTPCANPKGRVITGRLLDFGSMLVTTRVFNEGQLFRVFREAKESKVVKEKVGEEAVSAVGSGEKG